MAGSSVRSRKNGAGRAGTNTVRPTNFSAPNAHSARRALSVVGVILLGTSLVFWFFGNLSPSRLKWRWSSTSAEEWEDRREQVKDAFVSSWDAYTKYAWGESAYVEFVRKLNLAHQATTDFTPFPKKARR